jgi:hypothetical protein
MVKTAEEKVRERARKAFLEGKDWKPRGEVNRAIVEEVREEMAAQQDQLLALKDNDEPDWVENLIQKENKYNEKLSQINSERAAALELIEADVESHFEETFARLANKHGWVVSSDFRKEIECRVNYYYDGAFFYRDMKSGLQALDKPSADLISKRKKCISCKVQEACMVHDSLTAQQYAEKFVEIKKSWAETFIMQAAQAVFDVLKNKLAMEKEHRKWVEEQRKADMQKEVRYQEDCQARKDLWPHLKHCQECREMDYTELCERHSKRLKTMKEALSEYRLAAVE